LRLSPQAMSEGFSGCCAGTQLESERDPADFRGQHQEGNQHHGYQRDGEEADAEPLPHRIRQRVLADRGEPASHLYQKGNADSSQGNGPDQLKPEGGAGLGGGCQRSGLQKTTDAGDQTERDLQ